MGAITVRTSGLSSAGIFVVVYEEICRENRVQIPEAIERIERMLELISEGFLGGISRGTPKKITRRIIEICLIEGISGGSL